MSKLTKAQAKAHTEACRLLEQDRLTDDDRLYVLENWQESAKHINSIAGAFFTPWALAWDFSIETTPRRVIDLCAGIGALSLATLWRHRFTPRSITELVCVEANPDYASVGAKIVPEARWIVGDVFDLPPLGRFDCAIGNPPFGGIKRVKSAPRFTGKQFELHVIDVASDLADWGVFIVPQMTAPFKYSGCPQGGWSETIHNGVGSGYVDCPGELHDKLFAQTGITLEPNCGIDTSVHDKEWHGVSITTEVVTTDFAEARRVRNVRDLGPLFAEAAE